MRAILYKVKQAAVNVLAYIKKETSDEYKFGENNSLPNFIIATVNDSGTARSCITKLHKFIKADGFVNKGLGMANPSQSYDSLLSDFALNVSYLKAVTYRVLYDNAGNEARIYSTPTQQLRRIGSDKFRFNRLMGEPGYNKGHDKILQRYDRMEDKAVRMERIKKQVDEWGEQVGDVVYHFNKGMGLNYDVYPVPDYLSGLDDIESEAGLQRMEKRNIKRGWRTPIIVSTGPIDDTVRQDENGKTQRTDKELFDEQMGNFVGEDAASILHLVGATPETKPTVTTIPIADILDQTEKGRERVGRAVCRHMNVPPVLVGFSTAGQLGNTQELENSMKLFALSVFEDQQMISQALKIVYPDKDWTITTLSLFMADKPATSETTKGGI